MNDNVRKYALGILVATAVGAFGYLLYSFLQSRSPQEFTIATGRETGAYYRFATEYQPIIAELGYTLNIRPTAGSLETLALLQSGEVDVGFVQSGTARGMDVSDLNSLAAVFYEPMWIFFNQTSFAAEPSIIAGLESMRIGVGEVGSGTNQTARFLLAENGIAAEDATLVNGPSADQAQQLIAGELDVIFLVGSPASPLIRALFENDGLALMEIRRQKAYSSRYPGVIALTLPEGAMDLARNVPNHDIPLISTAAVLVGNKQFHPDLVRLLLIAATEVHQQGGLFEATGQFPNGVDVEIPMNEDAQKFLETGPTGLERFLPFWLASRFERIVFLILPALLLFYPFFRSTPLAVEFVTRFRISRRYKTVRQIEQEIEEYDVAQIDKSIEYLESMQQELTENFRIPLFYLDTFYNLRLHINLVIQRLEKRRAHLLGLPYEPAGVAGALADLLKGT